jgi:hypothetical protein
MKKELQTEAFTIADKAIEPGQFERIELPSPSLYTQTPFHIPVYVRHSFYKGPKLFIMATIHGDELNGSEIIRRLLRLPIMRSIQGTLIAVPIANIYGFIMQSRYLPDRRDLNRMFPGSKTGSLAARLANLLVTEVIKRCDYGIDLHTGAAHRNNLPQVRIDTDIPMTEHLAKVFNAPVILRSNRLPGSLRSAATEHNVPLLVYEAGEALRFDEKCIETGMKGCIAVMRELGMLPKQAKKPAKSTSMIAKSAIWVRAPTSGVFQTKTKLGDAVEAKELLGYMIDPFTDHRKEIIAPVPGVVIGKTNLPLVNEGDAVFHVACVKEFSSVVAEVEDVKKAQALYFDPLLDGWT